MQIFGGFVLNGVNAYDNSGNPISSAGDVNGDGINDLLIGAQNAGSNSYYGATGQTYAVFDSSDGFSAPKLISKIHSPNAAH